VRWVGVYTYYGCSHYLKAYLVNGNSHLIYVAPDQIRACLVTSRLYKGCSHSLIAYLVNSRSLKGIVLLMGSMVVLAMSLSFKMG